MQPQRHLLPTSLTLVPISDESLIGYVFRLGEHRYLPSARMLAASCGFEYFTNQPRPEWLASLSDSASMNAGKLAKISFGPPDRRFGDFRGNASARAFSNDAAPPIVASARRAWQSLRTTVQYGTCGTSPRALCTGACSSTSAPLARSH
jgi:hypothetical protein